MEDTAEVVDSPQTSDLSDVATDALRETIATPPEAEAQAEEQVVEEQSQPQEPTPEAEVEENSEVEIEGSETEEERLAKRRVRPRNELDQQVIDLYRSDGFSGSFADASRIIYGQTQESAPQAPPQQAEVSQPDPFSGYDAVTAKLSNEVHALEAQVAKAADELETTKALELQREIMKREMEIQNIRGRKERDIEKHNEAVQNTQRSKALESRDKAIEAYPELGDKESVYRKEFDDFVANNAQSPDYATIFQSPNWCELMAHSFASQKGYQRQAQPQAPQQQAPAVGTQARTLTTGSTAQPLNAPVTPERVRSDMSKMSNEDLFSLLGTQDNRKYVR